MVGDRKNRRETIKSRVRKFLEMKREKSLSQGILKKKREMERQEEQ